MKSNANKTVYVCSSCGNEFTTWSGKCLACGEWNTLSKLSVPVLSTPKTNREDIQIEKLSEISIQSSSRQSSGISELDRVLGGGIIPGSLILIGGEPGIGKSTLLLQIADKIDNTLYISGEESLSQIKQRADRLKINNKSLMLASMTDISSLAEEVEKARPGLIIIDSIQTVQLSMLPSSSGSLPQIKECGLFLQRIAKAKNIPIIIVGHVTKTGDLAGPKVLEHLVDTVLYFEGDRFLENRILRTIKNRFGSTNEVGIFTLNENGMIPVDNPSKLLLTGMVVNPGNVVTIIMEGKRPLLIEIQALTVKTSFGYPKRTSSGFDLNRLNLLAGVITKQTGLDLSAFDIYLNVAGGLRVSEPAADLAVCGAIISSLKNKSFLGKTCLIGEVGLSGEVRTVGRTKEREKEAERLGYQVLSSIKQIRDLNRELTSL